MIKKVFLLLLLFFILFELECSKQRGGHIFTVSWISNKEPSVTQYNLYWWHGVDSSQCPFKRDASLDSLKRYFAKTIAAQKGAPTMQTTMEDRLDNGWIRAGLIAEDHIGTKSGLAVSNFIRATVGADSISVTR